MEDTELISDQGNADNNETTTGTPQLNFDVNNDSIDQGTRLSGHIELEIRHEEARIVFPKNLAVCDQERIIRNNQVRHRQRLIVHIT